MLRHRLAILNAGIIENGLSHFVEENAAFITPR